MSILLKRIGRLQQDSRTNLAKGYLFRIFLRRKYNSYGSDSVVLSGENKVAQLKNDKSGKVVLCNEQIVDGKNCAIKFKILNISNFGIISLGVGVRSIVATKTYKFESSFV
jgi:hypothetical protein